MQSGALTKKMGVAKATGFMALVWAIRLLIENGMAIFGNYLQVTSKAAVKAAAKTSKNTDGMVKFQQWLEYGVIQKLVEFVVIVALVMLFIWINGKLDKESDRYVFDAFTKKWMKITAGVVAGVLIFVPAMLCLGGILEDNQFRLTLGIVLSVATDVFTYCTLSLYLLRLAGVGKVGKVVLSTVYFFVGTVLSAGVSYVLSTVFKGTGLGIKNVWTGCDTVMNTVAKANELENALMPWITYLAIIVVSIIAAVIIYNATQNTFMAALTMFICRNYALIAIQNGGTVSYVFLAFVLVVMIAYTVLSVINLKNREEDELVIHLR